MADATTGAVFTYQRKRKEFGKPACFDKIEPQSLVNIAPDASTRTEYVIATPTETEISNVPQLSCSSTNTEKVQLESKGMTHIDGGWPAAVDWTEVEDTIKYAKRVEREDNYLKTVAQLVATSKPILRVNAAVDVHAAYFEDEAAWLEEAETTGGGKGAGGQQQGGSGGSGSVAGGSGQSYAPRPPPGSSRRTSGADEGDTPSVLHASAMMVDPIPGRHRHISQISWTCGSESKKIAVAYTPERAGFKALEHETNGYMWDVTDPNKPDCALVSSEGCMSTVQCSPRDPQIVVGGTTCGVVQYWDLRHPKKTAGVSLRGKSHADSVSDVRWLMSKGLECFTVGADGMVKFWDLRQLQSPIETETVVLKTREASADQEPSRALCLDYDPMVGGAQKYLVGCADGVVLSCNRRGRTMQEKITAAFQAHYGAVFHVQRHPTSPKVFLSVGDWGFKLFSDDLRSPLLTSPFGQSHATCGRWHPAKPSALLLGRQNGTMEVWLVDNHSAPVASLTLTSGSAPLRCLAPHVTGSFCVTGDNDGLLRIVQFPSNLAEPSRGEKQAIGGFFERESSRERQPLATLNVDTANFNVPEETPDVLQYEGTKLHEQLAAIAKTYLRETNDVDVEW